MRMPRHWLFVTGGACLIAAIAIVGVSMGSAQNATATIGEPTADPTIDPCVEITQIESVGSDVSALQSEEECETPTETIPRTHTPTPEGTEPATEVADTSTPAPTEPPATDTPTGGAGAGGVQPPSTGFGPDGGNGGGLWLLLAGAALAAVGAGATVAGIRSR